MTYEWTADSKAILVPLDGDLYLAGLDGKVSRLTDSAGDELNPALSPKGGYVSLAGYYKKLTDFVNPSRNLPFDFAAVAASLPADIRSKLKTTMGVVSQPLNDGEGSLKGAEFTLSLPFSLLTPSLDGFGFYGSGSYTDSTIRLNSDPANPITLPGLSDWVGNASVYYEKHGLQLRAS